LKWVDAHSFCKKIYPKKASDLASIHDSHQNSFVRHLANNGKSNAWIGGFRVHPTQNNKSAFAWTDGSKFNYVAGEEVDLKNYHGDELCVAVNAWWKSGAWSTHNCEDKNVSGFICQTNSL